LLAERASPAWRRSGTRRTEPAGSDADECLVLAEPLEGEFRWRLQAKQAECRVELVGSEPIAVSSGLVSLARPRADASPPVLVGGGLRLLTAGVFGRWDLSSSTAQPEGALGLQYQRQ
jgi:hypothetical protein